LENKPLLMGEFGSFKADESSIGEAMDFTRELREAALEFGFGGSCFWTVNTFEQTRLWNMMWEEGAILEASGLNFPRALSDDFLLEFDAVLLATASDFYVKPPLGDEHQDDYFQLWLKFEEGDIVLFNQDHPSPAGLPVTDAYGPGQEYNFRISMDSSAMTQDILYKAEAETQWRVLFEDVSWAYGYMPAGRIVLTQESLSLSSIRTRELYSLDIRVDDGVDPLEGATVILAGDTLYSDASGNVLFSGLTAGSYDLSVSAEGSGQASSVIYVDGPARDTISLDGNRNYSFASMREDFVLEFDAIASDNESYFYIKPPVGDVHQDDYYQMKLMFGDGDITLFNGDYPSGLTADSGYGLNQDYNFRIYMDSSSMTQTVLYREDGDREWTLLFDQLSWAHSYTPSGRIVLPQNNLSLSNISTGRVYAVSFAIDDRSDPLAGADVILEGDTLTTDTTGIVVFPHKGFGTYNYQVLADGFEKSGGRVIVYDDHISRTVSLSEITRLDFTPMTGPFLLEFNLVPLAHGSDLYVKPPLGDLHQDDYFQTWLKFNGGQIILLNGEHQPPDGLAAATGYELLQKYKYFCSPRFLILKAVPG